MRYASVFFSIWVIAQGAAAQQAESPYVAFVGVERAAVRSGPAKVHYPTAQLERGTKVEVYRGDPGGWLAIRPPVGSFSLVPSKYVTLTSDPGVARVDEANVAALVGTTESTPDAFLWQVRLKRNETVEVLGVHAMDATSGDAKETWYKIAPPAGEFRWIHQRFVTRDAQAAMAGTQKESPGTGDEPEKTSQELRQDGFVARKQRPAATTKSDAVAVRPTENTPAPSPPTNTSIETSPSKERDLLAEIVQLDVELSLMVASDAAKWRTSDLRQRGETLLSQSTTELERVRAELLLKRIEEFHALEKRHREIALAASPADIENSARPEPEEPGSLVIDRANEIGTGLRERLNQPDPARLGPTFDGTGYLMPVHARRSDVPAFALVDKTGRIVQYVSPAPGLNLHRYRKLEVGVFGQRGFIPTLETPHVTAQRVIVLERNR